MKSVMSIKIEKSLIEKIRDFCQNHGLKQGFFVEKALREQLEREEMAEDIIELKQLRYQEKDAVDLDEYLKKKKA
jgi:predicted transcriptional regulator